MSTSNHFDESGHARMVDVSDKTPTVRIAKARGTISMLAETADLIRRGETSKGDVLAIARLAAIGATKLTSQLIPLCHAIPVESVDVEFDDVTNLTPVVTDSKAPTQEPTRARWRCTVTVKTTAKTGVEMEAMTAASIGCLTIYDMVKGVDRAVSIGPIELVEKSGGRSGLFQRDESCSS